MIKTIRTWIHRIKNYEEQMIKLEKSDRKNKNLMGQVSDLRKQHKNLQDEMKRLVSLLSGGTWNE